MVIVDESRRDRSHEEPDHRISDGDALKINRILSGFNLLQTLFKATGIDGKNGFLDEFFPFVGDGRAFARSHIVVDKSGPQQALRCVRVMIVHDEFDDEGLGMGFDDARLDPDIFPINRGRNIGNLVAINDPAELTFFGGFEDIDAVKFLQLVLARIETII